ncbi:2-dehydropantoate 2-reductase [Thiocapsa imhoffii]|uniref:2-dehydropantoate 2-reductase n=1 Tax=Thiocapsa imhoffii TaxID=382777 RepID=A0A9X1B8I3_9GAMM|nr:2-dehydropantoate 2-reductase [Thiocapsa imhoffii]MBK1644001.1 2-dehydropantoate 2-reductase [Thiocapsa imhoffii]
MSEPPTASPQTLSSVTVLGTGALGGFYGSRLLLGGCQVRFIARSDCAILRRDGLRVDSPLGDRHHAPIEVYAASDPVPASDCVLIGLKTTENHRLPELLRPLVHPGTIILNLQNGLTAEEELVAAFPEARVIGGVCFLCANKIGPGRIAHLDYGSIGLAPVHERDRHLLAPLMERLAAGGITTEELPSLADARWRKLAWNIPFNGLSVVLNANTDVIMADPDARRLATQLMTEVAQAAAACGHPFAPGFIAERLALTERMTPYAPSMRLDYLAHRPLEIEYLYRRPLREAQSRGLRLTAIEMLADQLTFLERHHQRNPEPGR